MDQIEPGLLVTEVTYEVSHVIDMGRGTTCRIYDDQLTRSQALESYQQLVEQGRQRLQVRATTKTCLVEIIDVKDLA